MLNSNWLRLRLSAQLKAESCYGGSSSNLRAWNCTDARGITAWSQPEREAALLQLVDGGLDPFMCSCIAYACWMGQILALGARRVLCVYILGVLLFSLVLTVTCEA